MVICYTIEINAVYFSPNPSQYLSLFGSSLCLQWMSGVNKLCSLWIQLLCWEPSLERRPLSAQNRARAAIWGHITVSSCAFSFFILGIGKRKSLTSRCSESTLMKCLTIIPLPTPVLYSCRFWAWSFSGYSWWEPCLYAECLHMCSFLSSSTTLILLGFSLHGIS